MRIDKLGLFHGGQPLHEFFADELGALFAKFVDLVLDDLVTLAERHIDCLKCCVEWLAEAAGPKVLVRVEQA